MEPERSCVICRGRAKKGTLLRFVYANGKLLWDRSGKMPGRGAYLHPKRGCWGKMTNRKVWQRATRVTDPEGVGLENLRSLAEAIRTELIDSDSEDGKVKERSRLIRL